MKPRQVTDAEIAAVFEHLLSINEGPLPRHCLDRRAPAGKVFHLGLAHNLQLPPRPAGNFNFVLTEIVTLPVAVEWTGEGVRIAEPEKQVARHRAMIRRRLNARLN